jgi:ADP-L-glycero-D-manno-heptose 6-epimerase
MLLVTGGAGFIGSNVVASLNEAGRHDVAVSDWLGHDGKWRNLQKRQLADLVPPGELDFETSPTDVLRAAIAR